MNILSDDVMWDLLFEILSNYEKGTSITSKIVKSSCNYLVENCKNEISTEDICDSVLGCFDYYNNYVKERNVDMRLISKDEYNMTVVMLNAAIDLILEEKK